MLKTLHRYFYPRPPRGGRLRADALELDLDKHFYPRPPRGGRLLRDAEQCRRAEFLSTPSARRATVDPSLLQSAGKNFYPRPPRGGRQKDREPERDRLEISIHALREEGDIFVIVGASRPQKFLSTPSARRATGDCLLKHRVLCYFYPRPPRGGRLFFTGHDIILWNFYPRPPRGGRHFAVPRRIGAFGISIHALREEGDSTSAAPMVRQSDFYPRPPRGGRHFAVPRRIGAFGISIHALREEGDRLISCICLEMTNFYPRPPRGGRHSPFELGTLINGISIHALREEGDFLTKATAALSVVFLSTPSARRATYNHDDEKSRERNFYPRPPRGGRLLDKGYCRAFGRISIHALREEGDLQP